MRKRIPISFMTRLPALAATLLIAACGGTDTEAGVPTGDAAAGATAGIPGVDEAVLPFTYTGPVFDLPPLSPGEAGNHETEADWTIVRGVLEWGRTQRLDLLPVGEVAAIVGSTFVGFPYTPGTLELPGPEALVVNLREFDCVTFVEHVLVLSRLIVGEVPLSGDGALSEAALRERYRQELTRLRYRGGILDGYASRLHYFSEWIGDGERKGLVQNVTSELGGIRDPRPIHFMSSNPDAYRQLTETPSLVEVVRGEEARLSAIPRHYIPEGDIPSIAEGIRNGDIIAAVSTVDGLDIAHTGIALWHGGRLHLLHAPLVGESVEISARPLAERILGIGSQQGIMVVRPLEPGSGGEEN